MNQRCYNLSFTLALVKIVRIDKFNAQNLSNKNLARQADYVQYFFIKNSLCIKMLLRHTPNPIIS